MSFINNVQGTVNPFSNKYQGGMFNGMDANLGNAMGAIGSAVGGVAGGLIADGRTSPAGDVINGLGDMASAIPGPWGAIAGVGLKAIGGLTNAAFGVKLNQENINAVNNNISAMNSFQSNASSFDALSQNMMSQPVAMNFDQKFIGKNGWFNKKATKKFNQLQAQQDAAEQFVNNSLNNNMNNLVNSQNQNLLANYAAKGGPLSTQGSDWSTGLTFINAGGSHEQNPNGGIQQGIAPDGQPNLVEEGEVIWNDYVFSKRLKVPKSFKKKYKVGREDEPLSYAEAAEEFNKEMEERPNDPISRRGRDANLARLAGSQEGKRAKSETISTYAANGGYLFPYGGLPVIDTNNYLYNPQWSAPSYADTYWGGLKDTKFQKELITKYINDLPEEAYSDLIKTIGGKALNYTKDRNGLVNFAYKGKPGNVYNGIWGSYNNSNKLDLSALRANPSASTSPLTPLLNTTPTITNPKGRWDGLTESLSKLDLNAGKDNSNSWLTGLRYAPVLGSAIGVFSDLMGWTNKPDYSSADAILNASRGVRDVSFTPIGDYMRYTPFDRMFYLNQLNANAGATRRGIANQSAGNRGTAIAGLLASDNNMLNSIGQLGRQAEEYNLAQRQKVAEFNRATNMFNSEGFLKAQQANQGASEVRMRAAQAAAAMRDAIDQRVGAARSANLTNLFESLGDIGREEAIRNMINSNPAWYWNIGRSGNLGYKRSNRANGGFITIKKRRK